MNQIDVGQLCSFCYYSLISFYCYILLVARNVFDIMCSKEPNVLIPSIILIAFSCQFRVCIVLST
jgi:hypothetical protein